MMGCIEKLIDKSWAILDVEYIQSSKNHKCIRKLYILAKNGYSDMEMEFYPCTRYRYLEPKYKRSFQFCRRNIHNLSYHPWKFSPLCSQAVPKLNEFIVDNDLELILYKGGTIERDLCEDLYIESMNIECFGDLEKAYSHDPRKEVHFYYDELIRYLC